jgi:hypothetical protein
MQTNPGGKKLIQPSSVDRTECSTIEIFTSSKTKLNSQFAHCYTYSSIIPNVITDTNINIFYRFPNILISTGRFKSVSNKRCVTFYKDILYIKKHCI